MLQNSCSQNTSIRCTISLQRKPKSSHLSIHKGGPHYQDHFLDECIHMKCMCMEFNNIVIKKTSSHEGLCEMGSSPLVVCKKRESKVWKPTLMQLISFGLNFCQKSGAFNFRTLWVSISHNAHTCIQKDEILQTLIHTI
jgi:hypothetical protein